MMCLWKKKKIEKQVADVKETTWTVSHTVDTQIAINSVQRKFARGSGWFVKYKLKVSFNIGLSSCFYAHGYFKIVEE